MFRKTIIGVFTESNTGLIAPFCSSPALLYRVETRSEGGIVWVLLGQRPSHREPSSIRANWAKRYAASCGPGDASG